VAARLGYSPRHAEIRSARACERFASSRLVVVAGRRLWRGGEGWLRFCYAVSEDVMDQRIERLAVVLPRLAEVVS